MTGEKIRSLRKDHRPSKDHDLLEPDEEAAAAGTFTSSGRTKGKSSKIFSNHKLIRSPSSPQQQSPPLNANTKRAAGALDDGGGGGDIDDDKKNAVVANCAASYPVHECVFKGDVRRLSSLIRTQNIAQKDVHGNTPLHLAVMMGHKVWFVYLGALGLKAVVTSTERM